MTIEMEGGVITKVSKARKGAKTAVAESPRPESSPKQKTRKLKLVKSDPVPAPETAPETPASTPPAKPKRKPKSFDAELDAVAAHAESLAGLADAYVGKMIADGKSAGTIASYKAELAMALKHLGAATPIASLTVDQVREFFESKPVTRLRSGRAKSPLSVDKTRRVLRLALVWAAEQGWVKTPPLPELSSAS